MYDRMHLWMRGDCIERTEHLVQKRMPEAGVLLFIPGSGLCQVSIRLFPESDDTPHKFS
jgi:hypothetical protein